MARLEVLVADVLRDLHLPDVSPGDCTLLLDGRAVPLDTPLRFANVTSRSKLELVTGREKKLGVQESSGRAGAAAARTPPAPVGQAAMPPSSVPGPSASQSPRPHVTPPPAESRRPVAAAVSSSRTLPATHPVPEGAAPASAPVAPGPSVPAGSSAAPGPSASSPASHARAPATTSHARAPATASAAPGSSASSAPAPPPASGAEAAMPDPSNPSVVLFGRPTAVFTREAEAAAAAVRARAAGTAAPDADLPDDFYDFTEADLRRALAASSRARARQGDRVLLTRKLREREAQREAEERASRHPRVPIRVHLPTGHVLQATFEGGEEVGKIAELAAKALGRPPSGVSLFTTPPRAELRDPRAMIVATGLAPAARVHVAAAAGEARLCQAAESLVGEPPSGWGREELSVATDAPIPAAAPIVPHSPGADAERTPADRPLLAPNPRRALGGGAPKWLKLSGR